MYLFKFGWGGENGLKLARFGKVGKVIFQFQGKGLVKVMFQFQSKGFSQLTNISSRSNFDSRTCQGIPIGVALVPPKILLDA